MKNETVSNEQPQWRAPELKELGNLRDFVRAGNAYGKSHINMDGNSDCGAEAMDSDNSNCM